MKKETDVSLNIPEIHFPDTIKLDDDIDFSVADFSIVDEEEQTRIIKPKMAKSAIYNKADFQYARDLAAKICWNATHELLALFRAISFLATCRKRL